MNKIRNKKQKHNPGFKFKTSNFVIFCNNVLMNSSEHSLEYRIDLKEKTVINLMN